MATDCCREGAERVGQSGNSQCTVNAWIVRDTEREHADTHAEYDVRAGFAATVFYLGARDVNELNNTAGRRWELDVQ